MYFIRILYMNTNNKEIYNNTNLSEKYNHDLVQSKNTKKKYKLIIINIPFDDWKNILYSSKYLICIDESKIDMYRSEEFKIVPICIKDYIKYNTLENNIFKNNLNNVDILNNKSKFGKFLLEHFPNNIAPIYYYNFDNETYRNDKLPKNNKLIVKPNVAFAGRGIRIVNEIIPNISEHIIQKYIEHTEYIVGHFLVLNGRVQQKIYFISSQPCYNGIKQGRISNYIARDTINIDANVFDKIFYNLNYSGFADSDFIIHDGRIIIFEINPRPGGSLIFNSQYLNIFLEKLIQICKIQ